MNKLETQANAVGKQVMKAIAELEKEKPDSREVQKAENLAVMAIDDILKTRAKMKEWLRLGIELKKLSPVAQSELVVLGIKLKTVQRQIAVRMDEVMQMKEDRGL